MTMNKEEIEKLKTLYTKHELRVVKRNGKKGIAAKKMSPEEVEWIRERKTEAMILIQEWVEEENERKRMEEIEEYSHLEKQLPPIPVFSSSGDDERAQKLLREAEEIRYYSGPESDGLNLSVSARKRELREEARKHCVHEIEIEINRTYTADARREIIRTVEC